MDVKAIARKLSQEKIAKSAPEEASTQQDGEEEDKPPIIPRRSPAAESASRTDQLRKSDSQFSMPALTPQELNWLPTGESMTLAKLASTNSSRFPLRIHLLDGYYGQTSRFTLSSSDIFDIHFAKRTQVLSVRDSSGTDYSIPLNSAIQFGLIYGYLLPKSKEEPLKMVYNTVQDLLSLDPLPKMVCATTAWSKLSDKEGKVGVEGRELLLVKGVMRSRLRSKRALKVFSLKTQTKKLLHEECEGNFSIDPEATKLHVYEFALKLKAHFPCKAMMFLGPDRKSDSSVFGSVPKSLLKKPISVLKVMSEVSLAATSVSNKQSPPSNPKVPHVDFHNKPVRKVLTMEIPLDSHLGDIEAEILQAPNEEETEKLYMNTKELLQKANKEPYMILLDKGSDRVNNTQSLLYTKVRSEYSDLGVTYETSEAIYERMEIGEGAGYSVPRVYNGTQSKAASAQQQPARVEMDVLSEEGDDSVDHEYEELDRTLHLLSLRSAAAQQLAPTSPSHFSPLHLPPPQIQHKRVHLPDSGASLSSRYTTPQPPPGPPPPLEPQPTTYSGASLSSRYTTPQPPPGPPPPLEPQPTTYSGALLSSRYTTPQPPPGPPPPLEPQPTSYVDLFPPTSVQGKTPTLVSDQTKAANRDFLRTMSESEVRLCTQVWA